MYKLKRLLKFTARNLRAACFILKTAIGIKDNPDGTENYRSLHFAGWSFLIGIPAGTILFGAFSIEAWFFIVLFALVAANIDRVIKAYSVLRKSGASKVIIPEEA